VKLPRYWGAIPVTLAIALVALRACVATPPLANLASVASEPRDPPGSHALAGSLAIARGGPVIVGFQSTEPARLTIAGHEIVGRSVMTDRIVLPAGPIAIRLAGDGRLVWSPVGRRGDVEYVPASSLSPEAPERATFSGSVGAAPFDGAIALALLALLVASLCMLARRRLRAVPRDIWLAMAAIFVVACVVRWIDLGGAGQTWDEDVNWTSGRNYITNLLSLDFSADSWRWNFEHPPVMKYLAGIGAQLADGFGPARALSAIWIALGCALLVPIGARLYRPRVGMLAGAIAALLPPLVAHGQIVGHESPSVLWWALGVVLALGVHDGEPSLRALRVRLAWVGVVVGVSVASRFVGGLLGPLCLAIVVIQAPRERRGAVLVEAFWILPLVAVITLYALWPRLWLHPIGALQESLVKLNRAHSPEPFLGEITSHPALYYFVVYLLATLPVGVLAGCVAWAVRALRARDRAALLTALFVAVPLLASASPVRQDGVRYVLPSVAALALCAAAGVDYVARVRRAFPAIAAALVAYLAIVLVRIHPYYLDYFGEQVGGAGAVAARGWFETAWWGEGLDRAVAYVNEHAPPGARVCRDCIEPAHLAWFRYDLWTPMVRDPSQAEWIVTYSTHACPVPKDAKRVFSVDADGAVLAEVWQR
jgi:4-amino-4-deoxy-L-arabinose transferase-like glycosyltransferase